jgi:glutamate/tyrosine decarboxylase-like PLP-dependent enzyme
MSSAVQVCWEKATRYFEIEEKLVYCTPDRYVIDPEETVNLVDENTIGICAILGTTYGQFNSRPSKSSWQAWPGIVAEPKGSQ